MKTFETEKHNIPEGATHYLEATDSLNFAWWNSRENTLLCPENSGEWQPALISDAVYNPTPIPQTKEVEWVNGDECVHGHHNYAGASKMTYIGAHPFVVGKHVCLSELKGLIAVDSTWLRKPETEAERVERERVNAIVEMASIAIGPEFDLAINDRIKDICSKIHNAGYRKESE